MVAAAATPPAAKSALSTISLSLRSVSVESEIAVMQEY